MDVRGAANVQRNKETVGERPFGKIDVEEQRNSVRDIHMSECNLLSAKDNRRIGPDGRTSVQPGSREILMELVG